ncbi:MAG: HNH endonuclease signature motif containing protein [Hyphomonadaceae bacterium]|nr:HNH endonuclease signature motif containing protein [Hyphomonadaceae bacterium]
MKQRALQPVPVAPLARRKLSRIEFAQLMLDQEGRCACCREKLRSDLIIDEHVTALDHGGTNDLSNRALYCTACARAKTEDDLAESLHGRRVRGEIGQKYRRNMRQLKPGSQPPTFATNRDGPLKRKINGQVVRRPKQRKRVRPVRSFSSRQNPSA